MSTKPVKARKKPRATSAFGQRRDLALENGKEAYQEKRREIAKAAAVVFNKYGLRGTSLKAVAEALGMSRAALYYYIPNKRELFDELVREAIEMNVARAEVINAGDESAIEKIRMLMIDLMLSCETNYPLLYIFLRENLSHVESQRTEWSRRVREQNQRYERIVISVIEDGIKDGTLRPIASPRIIAYGIFGLICWTSRWFNPHTSLEKAEVIGAAFAEMAVSGIRARAPE